MRTGKQAAACSESEQEERLADRERSDGELLACFVASHDDVALAVLVARYTRMMLAVCRKVLCHRQDAEDAYQATLLVLMRKADSLSQEEMIGGWLHGAAYHEAKNVEKSKKRREYHEGRCETTQTTQTVSEAIAHEERDLVNAAAQRLPEQLRAVVVLCCLEGKTNAEAARILGLPKGTVATQKAKARKLVRQDLMSNGIDADSFSCR